ncbi:MAG: bifunctional nuclease family protein [Crocinitomicaceae bacterium]|nr:bifunctional nuclease family protein [Crocinitomicaceae bacterium]MDG1659141.1 bifunctional nuclease family protein [Crocinitomicaceae bacterium]MDG2440629.1 bifunctional nuclease family protein [Crocinitomicaceae bacterium]|tara:strand:+ start:9838 stop:10428 length:591 start_codon:yes stop_codon:yes gene_type:complete
MDKIKLEIVGLSYSQTQSGAYALVLSEVNGSRRLPIIIGGFEAQAIAIELEKMVPTRPLTHDLFKNFATTFDINVKEVVIDNLVEGIFYSKLICEMDGKITKIDARTSDAIAIGVRFQCPVYTFESILSSAGILLDESTEEDENLFAEMSEEEDENKDSIESRSVEELEAQLTDALANEEYERASKLRDEINKRGA